MKKKKITQVFERASFIDMEKANKFLEIIDHNTFFREDSFKKIVVDGDELVERLTNEESE